jgi:hypothetical protein
MCPVFMHEYIIQVFTWTDKENHEHRTDGSRPPGLKSKSVLPEQEACGLHTRAVLL